jgi:hypothetical protein
MNKHLTSRKVMLSIALSASTSFIAPVDADRRHGSVRQTRQTASRSANVSRNTVHRNTNVNVNRNVNVNTGGRGYARPRGAVVAGEERAVAVGRRGAVAVGEEGAAAVGRRGAVAVGEEGAVGVGRYGRVYASGEVYEDHEGWKVAAGVATGIAVGTMLARPPTAATAVVVSGSNYYYADGVYYSRVAYGGAVQYQVVSAPPGAVIAVLPGGCTTYMRGGIAYRQCGGTYYQQVSGGYRVVVF